MNTHIDASDRTLFVLQSIEAKLDKLSSDVATVTARQRRMENFVDEMLPISKVVLDSAVHRFQEFEERGYFAFGSEVLHLIGSVVTGVSPDDVRLLSDNVTRLVSVVKRLTGPGALELLEGAAEATDAADHQDPIGVMGILNATRSDDDVRRGLGILVEVLRQVGHAANEIEAEKEAQPRKMNPLLGSKRNLKPRAESRHPKAHAASTTRKSARGEPGRPPASQTTQAEPPLTTVDGIHFGDDGFIVDPGKWSDALAMTLAASHNIALTDAHWTVLRFIRVDYETRGASPNIRRITTESGVSTKELYALFPKAPAKTAARIAGVKKPVGCV